MGGLLWCLIVVPAVLVGAAHWSDLTANLIDRVTTPHNLVLLWFLFPVIKALHEFGHAFAVKVFGGEVHEMGIMLLVLSPFPMWMPPPPRRFRADGTGRSSVPPA